MKRSFLKQGAKECVKDIVNPQNKTWRPEQWMPSADVIHREGRLWKGIR